MILGRLRVSNCVANMSWAFATARNASLLLSGLQVCKRALSRRQLAKQNVAARIKAASRLLTGTLNTESTRRQQEVFLLCPLDARAPRRRRLSKLHRPKNAAD